jgi:peroxidase
LVPEYPVFFGRRDSFTANISAANEFLPSPAFGYSQLKQNFAKKNLSELDLAALSGAHTIGRVKCLVIRNVTLVGQHNISSKFLDFLNKTVCPPGTQNPTGPLNNQTFKVTDLDLGTPNTFDTNYYKNIRKSHGMMPSDQALQSTPGVNQKYVAEFASNTSKFFHQFAKSTIKMGNISPLEGHEGEIRLNCRKRNPTVLRMVTSD